MLQNPKVSVLMPVYNCELYIREAVDSILNQTFADFEFIIIDDCSADATVSIIKSFNDSRINLIIKPQNTGYTNSLNYGLSIAKGEYIARMDGDDISLPKRFTKQVQFLDKNEDYALCATALKIINSDKIIQYPENHNEIKIALLDRNCIIHPSVMLRKSVLDDNNINYDISKEPAEDYDLWVRISRFSKLYNIPEILINYRVHGSQVTKTRNELQIKSATETKLMLWNFLKIDSKTNDFLKKIINNNELNFNEIKYFNTFKNKLLLANTFEIFEKKGFIENLLVLEKKILNEYFFNRLNYNPTIFFQYLILKNKSNIRFDYKKVIKLLIKSFVFWKIKQFE